MSGSDDDDEDDWPYAALTTALARLLITIHNAKQAVPAATEGEETSGTEDEV